MLIIYVCINLRGRDWSMTEKCLNSSDVCSFFYQCRSETMSEGMWCHFFIDTSQFRIFSDYFFDTISTEMFSKPISRKTYKQIRGSIYPFFTICFQCVDSGFCREYRTEFWSFSDNRKLIRIQFDVFFFEHDQFRHSQSCPIQKLQYCKISRLLNFIFRIFQRCGKYSSYFFVIQIIHFSRRCFCEF